MNLPDKLISEVKNPYAFFKEHNKDDNLVNNISEKKVTVPEIGKYKQSMNVWKLFLKRYIDSPNATCIENYNIQKGAWQKMSVSEFFELVSKCAKGFIELGIKKGTKVCLMSKTRYEWGLFDMALLSIGAVVVPIYQTASEHLIKHIIHDSRAQFAICENQEYADSIVAKNPEFKNNNKLFVIDMGFVNYLIKSSKKISDDILLKMWNNVSLKNLATIIYTSGTTSKPKGVKISHSNLCHMYLNILKDNSIDTINPVLADPKCRTLMFLPLAHGYAMVVQLFVYCSESVIGYCPDITRIVDYCKSFKPTFIVVVPRIIEKIYNSAYLSANTKIKNLMFKLAAFYSNKISLSMSKGEYDYDLTEPKITPISYKVFNLLVYKKIKKLLGGNLKYIISGGAPLEPKLAHFFRGMGIKVLEGYGLTETTAAITLTRPNTMHIGACGKPFPGTTIKLANDNEVLVKGMNLFIGYRGNLKIASRTANGYYRTGDIGRFDEKGRLYITGRKKEIIVTSGGKNITPSVFEDKLQSHPLISKVFVVGNNKPFVSALITLDKTMIGKWLKLHNINSNMSINQARTSSIVQESIKKAIKKVNAKSSKAEAIKKVHILNTDWTEKNGYMTTTQKLKRKKVEEGFQPEIEELYKKTENKASIDI